MRPAPRRQLASVMRSCSIAAWVLCCVLLAAAGEGGGSVPGASAAGSAGGPAPPVPAYRQASTVAILTIRGEIDQVTYRSLERRIRQAVADGADAIVLEIDTPGGRLDVTLDICNLLKDPAITPPNTVAWIHPEAYSAGTIIALACREIVISPNATFGDAAPIYGLPIAGMIQMAASERAKVESPLLSEVIDSARRNHYDENLVQSFVSVGIELWLVENVDTGERYVVDRNEYMTVFGDEPPDQITRTTPSGSGAATITPGRNTIIPQPDPTQGISLTPEQIREQIEYQQQLPPLRQPLTEADRGRWRLATQIVSDDRLLVVKPAEALFYGLATTIIADDEQLKAFFGASTVTRYGQSWSEYLVRFLTNPIVMGVLIVIFLICLFIEIAAPGVGVFGATAAVALLILIGAPFLAGMAQWWDILLIGLGMVLVLAEIFVIPGFGVAGLAGAICLMLGLIGVFVTGDITTPKGQEELWKGIVSTLTALFAGGVGIWLVSRQLDTSPLFGRIMLKAEVGSPGRSAAGAPTLLQAMGEPQRALGEGDVGLAATDLRPAGRGEFGGRVVDVQSVGRYIDKGTPIRVISVGRYVIEVEEAER